MLNRSALVLRPAQPYIDWAASLDPTILPDRDGEQTVYLLPAFGDQGDLMELLEALHADLFARELFGWHEDPAAWPKDRSFEAFQRWFTIEWHSVIEDLCEEAIEDDHLEYEGEGDDDA